MPDRIGEERLRELLTPFLRSPDTAFSADLLPKLSTYLDLLMRWNEKVNLTAIRRPEEIVTRHFGESLFAAERLPGEGTLLDLGSGAGFPGLPIQLLHRDLAVTLAESRSRKAAFLLEAVRVLELSTTVWPRRVEDLPAGMNFDVVALRAVDSMRSAVTLGSSLARHTLCVLGAGDLGGAEDGLAAFSFRREALPLSEERFLLIGSRDI